MEAAHIEAYNSGCFLPTVKHRGGSVIVWVAISWNFFGFIIALHGSISSKDYLNIFGGHVYRMAQALFSDGDDVFQDDNALSHTAHVVKHWYEEDESEQEHTE